MLLEVPCGNIESVYAAKLGGADRIELCSALPLGGLSPSLAFLENAATLGIDLFVMVRPREGDFIYTSDEFKIMLREIEHFKKAGAKGIVSGILKVNGEIDTERCQELIEFARPLPFTFHRAFDLTNDAFHSLDVLTGLKADRILTSGHSANAWLGKEMISKLVVRSQNKIGIIAGAGINPENVETICKETRVMEVHLSGKVKKRREMTGDQTPVFLGTPGNDDVSYDVTDATIIKKVKGIINGISL